LLASAGALVVSACGPKSRSQEPPANLLPLKSVCPAPVGCAVTSQRLTDPAFTDLLTRNVSQLTAEWEMKMEYILQADGAFRFDAPDAIAAFASDHQLRLFGHTLVWYAQDPAAFHPLDGKPGPFADALRNYILAVVGRYRGRAVGWDVVNEAVAEDGDGLRDCLWSRNLGQIDYMRRAFDNAREADPTAVLLINDYNLESLPKKRATFMRLVETLLKSGAPVTGIGTQSHIAADLKSGAVTEAIRDLASLGLPIHVSELDISLNRGRGLLSSDADLQAAQNRLAHEVAEAFAALPARQRFAFTVWGLRGGDSWLRSPKENSGPPWDQPLPFDDEGRPRPMLAALEQGFGAKT
jgi:endo-1,4-beta-xylanase